MDERMSHEHEKGQLFSKCKVCCEITRLLTADPLLPMSEAIAIGEAMEAGREACKQVFPEWVNNMPSEIIKKYFKFEHLPLEQRAQAQRDWISMHGNPELEASIPYHEAVKKGRELLGQIREPIFAFKSKKYPSADEINAYWLSRMDDLTARLEAEQSPDDVLEAVKDQVKDWTKEQQQALYVWMYEALDCRIYQK